LDETAWTYLRNDDGVWARQYFQDSVQAYTDVASVRRVGLSTRRADRNWIGVLIAAAAEVYAHREGIGNRMAGARGRIPAPPAGISI